MKIASLKTMIISLGLALPLSQVHSENVMGGVSLGATRVIYPIDAKQVSIPVINHGQKDRYLINSWVGEANQEKSKDFLVTPPLFVSQPNTENTLRIIKVTDAVPYDRESVYWLNVKAIPSIKKEDLETKNLLQLAVLSRIKIFVRPNDLPYNSEAALEHINFTQSSNGIEVNNQSPYHVSFVNIYIDGEKSANTMAKPLSKTLISNISGKKISYQTVNDFGGLTPKVELTLPKDNL